MNATSNPFVGSNSTDPVDTSDDGSDDDCADSPEGCTSDGTDDGTDDGSFNSTVSWRAVLFS